MPSELTTVGNIGLGLIVKRIKGKLYVYEYVRFPDGRKVERYVAPLEEIVRLYQARQAGIDNSYRQMKPHALKRLAKHIVDNLTQKMGERWWTGRDLNPGPLGCQPSTTRELPASSTRKVIYNASGCLEITEGLIKEFESWLVRDNPRLRESTLKQYMYYIPRLAGVKLCGKDDVPEAFKAMGGLSKSSYEAFSRFLTFLDKTKELDELVVKLRKAMPKKPRTRADTYVPTDEEVLKVKRNIIASGDEVLKLFYNVLISTGCRGTEARYLINNIGRLRTVDLGSYVRVHVDLQRGSKNEFVMYLPAEVYQQLKEFRGKLPHQDTIEDGFRELGLSVKYFRKWFRQTLKKLGIDSEDIEAFQGRVSTIGGRHYTDWIPLLDKDYMKVLPKIREFIIYDGLRGG